MTDQDLVAMVELLRSFDKDHFDQAADYLEELSQSVKFWGRLAKHQSGTIASLQNEVERLRERAKFTEELPGTYTDDH